MKIQLLHDFVIGCKHFVVKQNTRTANPLQHPQSGQSFLHYFAANMNENKSKLPLFHTVLFFVQNDLITVVENHQCNEK